MNASEWFCIGVGVAFVLFYLAVFVWVVSVRRGATRHPFEPAYESPPERPHVITLHGWMMAAIIAVWERDFEAFQRGDGPQPSGYLTGVVSWCHVYQHGQPRALDLSVLEREALRELAARHSLFWLLQRMPALNSEVAP